VPHCEHLRVLRRRRPGDQGKPRQHLNKEPVDQTNEHDRRSSDVTIAQVKLDGRILDQDRHLMIVLREYEDFYNTHRPHRTLSQAAPLRPLPGSVADLDQFQGPAALPRRGLDS